MDKRGGVDDVVLFEVFDDVGIERDHQGAQVAGGLFVGKQDEFDQQVEGVDLLLLFQQRGELLVQQVVDAKCHFVLFQTLLEMVFKGGAVDLHRFFFVFLCGFGVSVCSIVVVVFVDLICMRR